MSVFEQKHSHILFSVYLFPHQCLYTGKWTPWQVHSFTLDFTIVGFKKHAHFTGRYTKGLCEGSRAFCVTLSLYFLLVLKHINMSNLKNKFDNLQIILKTICV